MTKTGSVQHGKRWTSASHLDGKIPLIFKIRTESLRQGALAPSSSPPPPTTLQQTRLCWPQSSRTHFREPTSPKNTTPRQIPQVSKKLLMANLGTVDCLTIFRSQQPTVLPRITMTPGGGSVYFLLIRAVHYRSFTARGVGSHSVFCVHSTSTPALSIMVSALSRHVSPPTHLSPPHPAPKCFLCLMSSQLPTQGESWSLLLKMSNQKRFRTRNPSFSQPHPGTCVFICLLNGKFSVSAAENSSFTDGKL